MASAFQHFSISAFQGDAFQVSSSITAAQSIRPFTKERRQITMQQLPIYQTFRS